MDVLYGKSLIINFLNKLLKNRTAIRYLYIKREPVKNKDMVYIINFKFSIVTREKIGGGIENEWPFQCITYSYRQIIITYWTKI